MVVTEAFGIAGFECVLHAVGSGEAVGVDRLYVQAVGFHCPAHRIKLKSCIRQARRVKPLRAIQLILLAVL